MTWARLVAGGRRHLAGWIALVCMAGSSLTGLAGCKKAETVRIGYQKFGVLLVLKERGTLEPLLKASNVSVEWSEFPSGPPMMEALHAGKIDFGVAGEAPPVFAQASDAPIVYVGSDPPSPRAEAILVRKASPIQSLADLKGKKIALNRGSNVHYFLAKALEAAAIPYDQVTLEFLPPADARAAFESGAVDAWVIWDPFLSSALRSTDSRILRDATGLAENVPYYLATREFAVRHGDVVKALEGAIRDVDAYVGANPHDVAALLAPKIGMQAEAIEDSLARNTFAIGAISPEIVANQQHVADAFFALGLLPHAVTIADAVLPISN
jgi:sulfonate transport system substrate-binding protein